MRSEMASSQFLERPDILRLFLRPAIVFTRIPYTSVYPWASPHLSSSIGRRPITLCASLARHKLYTHGKATSFQHWASLRSKPVHTAAALVRIGVAYGRGLWAWLPRGLASFCSSGPPSRAQTALHQTLQGMAGDTENVFKILVGEQWRRLTTCTWAPPGSTDKSSSSKITTAFTLSYSVPRLWNNAASVHTQTEHSYSSLSPAN